MAVDLFGMTHRSKAIWFFNCSTMTILAVGEILRDSEDQSK